LTYGVCSLTAEKVKKDKSADAAEAKDLDDDGEPKKKSAAKKDWITTYYTVHLDSGEEHHTTDLPSLTFCCDVADDAHVVRLVLQTKKDSTAVGSIAVLRDFVVKDVKTLYGEDFEAWSQGSSESFAATPEHTGGGTADAPGTRTTHLFTLVEADWYHIGLHL